MWRLVSVSPSPVSVSGPIGLSMRVKMASILRRTPAKVSS